MIIRNAKLRRTEPLMQIRIRDGIIAEVAQHLEAADEEPTIDAGGCLTLPPFVEPHIHLDTALTAGEPAWNMSGTLFEGIQRWAERKPMLSRDDVKRRARKALLWQIAQGVQHVRTHVDVTDPNLTALEAMLEVKAEMAPYADLQIVAFPQEGILSYPNGLELLEEALRMGADAVGAIPHYEFTREDGVESLKRAFELAVKYNRLVDVHCDETDDEQSRFVETVAAEAYRRGIGELVTASHTTAMHSYNHAYVSKLLRLFRLSGIHFVANPLVNVHLQGRFDTYPKRRGLTRVKELTEAGINVCFGHDDIIDPWYPLGTGNMLQVLLMGLHAGHLTGYEQIAGALDFITVNGAKALRIEERYGIEAGKPANLIILDAASEYDAIRKQAAVRYSIREGRIIAETTPSRTEVRLGGRCEAVDFIR